MRRVPAGRTRGAASSRAGDSRCEGADHHPPPRRLDGRPRSIGSCRDPRFRPDGEAFIRNPGFVLPRPTADRRSCAERSPRRWHRTLGHRRNSISHVKTENTCSYETGLVVSGVCCTARDGQRRIGYGSPSVRQTRIGGLFCCALPGPESPDSTGWRLRSATTRGDERYGTFWPQRRIVTIRPARK
jgi:hypothetical protein